MRKIQYRSGFKYQLAEKVTFQAPELKGFEYKGDFLKLRGSVMTLRAGYCWDGPSGPMVDTPAAMVGSLGHDGGAQISRNSPEWDEETRDRFVAANNLFFHRLCREAGMGRFRAWYAFTALRFVDSYADPSSRKLVEEAP